jgi:hypothetical protein
MSIVDLTVANAALLATRSGASKTDICDRQIHTWHRQLFKYSTVIPVLMKFSERVQKNSPSKPQLTPTILQMLSMYHLIQQDRGAYKHKYSTIIVVNINIFFEKILKTTIYRLWLLKFIVIRWRSLQETLVMLTQAGYWFILRFCEHFTCLSS